MKLNAAVMTTLPSAIIVAIVLAIYWPALSGALFYDDYQNLGALRNISDIPSALHFITHGQAGPLGRPLSLLTFAAQADAWPNKSESLLLFNISLHAANAFIIYWLILLILEFSARDRFTSQEKIAISLLATAIWSLTPLLASTSLILVQRMTGLSALFILSSIVAYLLSFRINPKNPALALALQIAIVGCGTILAALAKESGALLPIYLLVLEATLLLTTPEAKPFRRLRLFALSLPLLALLIYLSPLARSWFEVNEFRGFSSWQRLQSQSVLLWKYLYLACAPKLSQLGPFQDGVGLIENSRLIVFASIAWAIALIAGFISWRRFPWLLFAVLWFLLGHLLESTTLLLELYFEHRNYLPLLGFAITLAVLTYSVSGRLRRSAQIFSYLYVGVLGASLIGFTNLWGQPLKAAEFWANTRPSSARAAVHFANLSTGMPSEGINGLSSEISSVQRINHALQVLDGIRHLCPNCVELDIQRLAYSCFVRSEQDRISRYQELIFALRDNNYNVNITMVDGFALIGSLLSKGECDPLTFQMLDEAIDELIENGNWLPNSLRVRLLYQRATLSYAQSDFPQAEEWILKAETVDILAIPVIEFQLEFYREVKRYSDGIESIDRRLEWIKKSEREPFEEELLQRLSEQRRSLEEEIKKTHH